MVLPTLSAVLPTWSTEDCAWLQSGVAANNKAGNAKTMCNLCIGFVLMENKPLYLGLAGVLLNQSVSSIFCYKGELVFLVCPGWIHCSRLRSG
jgi:hypothetical protein